MNAHELRHDGTEEPRWGGAHDCQHVDGRRDPRGPAAPLPGAVVPGSVGAGPLESGGET